LRKWGIVVFAGALEIQDRVAGNAAPFAGQLGAELACRAELGVTGKQPLVRRIRTALDDDFTRLQLESADDGLVDAPADEASEPCRNEGDHPANRRPIDAQVQKIHHGPRSCAPKHRTTWRVARHDRTPRALGRPREAVLAYRELDWDAEHSLGTRSPRQPRRALA
jgi:hypothetical protein